MKNKHIKSIIEFNENSSNEKLHTPYLMMVGSQYQITEPDYDNVGPDINKASIVEVVKRSRYGFILRDIEHNFTYERTFQHLMDCEIIEI
jgi:hypothetical protein